MSRPTSLYSAMAEPSAARASVALVGVWVSCSTVGSLMLRILKSSREHPDTSNTPASPRIFATGATPVIRVVVIGQNPTAMLRKTLRLGGYGVTSKLPRIGMAPKLETSGSSPPYRVHQ